MNPVKSMNLFKLEQFQGLTDEDINRIIEMAWEDRTPFEAIHHQFKLKQDDVMLIMRAMLHHRNWKKWRAHTKNRLTKHLKLRGFVEGRHKCTQQKQISGNRVSKR